jgi:Ser/Thr protein kinase RdoA (MazF antagonist)
MDGLLALYGLNKDECTIQNFGSGLINHTWLIRNIQEAYILQKVNKNVFLNPEFIDRNIQLLNKFLLANRVNYEIVSPLNSLTGRTMVRYENEYYRLFKYIPSKSYSVVTNATVAFEAAKQFGLFTKILSAFDIAGLNETIPHFHDLNLRYTQFSEALRNGNSKRIEQSKNIIHLLQHYKYIVDRYTEIIHDPTFKKRVTHHDTKISNVLFDENNNGIAVIDLDTVMPGYFISDVGDMLRTYLSPASEEETNLALIEVRDDYFKAIAAGYLSEMKEDLSAEEINAFVYAGKFMIYMQVLRFITDYLNNDIYYGAKYPQHNFNRAQNQLRLLECLIEKEELYNAIVDKLTIHS